MSEFDINILNNLQGKQVKGSGFELYDTKSKGGNENNIFDTNEISAIKNDLEIHLNKTGSMNKAIASIFNNDKQIIKNAFNTITNLEIKQELSQYETVKSDNTRVVKNIILPIPKKNIEPARDGRTAYLTEFNNYKPKNQQEYNKIFNFINNYKINGKICNIEPERAEAIARMVCSLSEEYGISPEIVITILANESGGFNFSDEALGEKLKKGQKKFIYKGAMQVDLENIECLYGYSLNKKHPDPIHNDRIQYDHEHYYQKDIARINELKQIYKTPQDLFNAISKDVSLGVEVGIMAYKGKLCRAHGNTKEALRQYNRGHYFFPNGNNIPKKINNIPEYKK